MVHQWYFGGFFAQFKSRKNIYETKWATFALIYALTTSLSGYGVDEGIKHKKLAQWKRCADLAVTCNSGETVRRCIFNHANYSRWRVRLASRSHAYSTSAILVFVFTIAYFERGSTMTATNHDDQSHNWVKFVQLCREFGDFLKVRH